MIDLFYPPKPVRREPSVVHTMEGILTQKQLRKIENNRKQYRRRAKR